MPKPMTATELRANLYRVLDEVAAGGRPRTIVRKGCEFVIQRKASRKRRRDLSKLKPRLDSFNGTFDELAAITWDEKGNVRA